MPYIPDATHRQMLDDGLARPKTVGELNFVITRRIDDWIADRGVSYAVLNEAIGILLEAQNFDRLPLEGDIGRDISNLLSAFAVDTAGNYKRREVKAVLECAKLELYRRVVAPYEQQKLELNGDVYT